MSLTLCLIVKNEAAYLDRCVQSVQNIVSEVVIGDTGSTDSTLEIAKKYTRNVGNIDFSFGFSHARNTLLKKVKTEWVLFLDADEYFDVSQAAALKIQLETTKNVDAFKNIRYNFFSTGGFYLSDVIRIFKNDPLIRYSGIIVDSIRPSLEQNQKNLASTSLVLNHFGHCRSLKVRNEKAYNYLQMMEKELQENPLNYKVMGYKALILKSLGFFDLSIENADAALKIAPSSPHLHFVKARVLRGFDSPDEEIFHYNQALKLEPNNLIYLNNRGVAHLTHGMIKQAQEDFTNGLHMAPNQPHFKINLGLTFEATEQFAKAYSYYKKVAHSHPAFLKCSFSGNSEVDPFSGNIYDTIFRFLGLAYHMAYCKVQCGY